MCRHNRDHGGSEHGGHAMTVRELVNGNVVWVGPDATLRQAALLMMSTEVGSVAIEVDGALEGILTERDIRRAVAEDADLDQDRASTWMTEYPDSFTPDMNVEEAAEWMLATGFRPLPVGDGKEALGVIRM